MAAGEELCINYGDDWCESAASVFDSGLMTYSRRQ